MLKRLIFSLVAMSWAVHPCAAGVELVPAEAGANLAEIRDDGAPIVRAHYVAWGRDWAWASAQQRFPDIADDAGRVFAFAVESLGVQGDGLLAARGNVARWTWRLAYAQAHEQIIGGGLEWNLVRDAPSRFGHDADPVLLEGNRGWTWDIRPGQTLRVEFDPPASSVHFERGDPSRIRSLFIPPRLAPGTQQATLTVTLPDGGVVQRSLAERYGQADDADWFASALDPHRAFVDLSHLNHTPAGKFGRPLVRGEQYVLPDGTPLRFWGANLQAYTLFLRDREKIQRHARRMAELGFNLARLHHHDSARWVNPSLIADGPTSQQINDEALDAYFYWVHCLREQGLYIWVDLHVGRVWREGDQIPGWEEIARGGEGDRGVEVKGFHYMNDRMTALMKQFAGDLLTRVNPYTGMALKDDPAVMGILLVNENDLTNRFGNTFLPDKGNPHHQQVFEARRDALARRLGLDPERAGRTWEPGDAKIVLNELEHAWNAEFIAFLRGLGVTAPIATGHQWAGNPMFSLPALTAGDLIDVHTYTDGEFLNDNPRFASSWIHYIAASQLSGRPLTITEYNIDDSAAGQDPFTVPLFVAAMAALHGWDAPMLYGYSQDGLSGRAASPWSAYSHPGLVGLSPAAALMYRRGDVSPARRAVLVMLDRDSLLMRGTTVDNAAALRTAAEMHQLTIGLPAVKELPWLAATQAPAGAEIVTDLARDFIPPGQTHVESDTGEIRRDWARGVQTINAARSQAAIGWLGGERVELADLTVELTTPKAAVVLSSLDDMPLRASQRILISTAARVRRTAQGYRSEPVAGTLRLRSDAASLSLRPLAGDGRPGAPIALQRDPEGRWVIPLPTDLGTHWFELRP